MPEETCARRKKETQPQRQQKRIAQPHHPGETANAGRYDQKSGHTPLVAITVVARCGSISLRSPIRLSSRGHMGGHSKSPSPHTPRDTATARGKTAPETCPPSPSDHPAAIQRNRQSGRADGPPSDGTRAMPDGKGPKAQCGETFLRTLDRVQQKRAPLSAGTFHGEGRDPQQPIEVNKQGNRNRAGLPVPSAAYPPADDAWPETSPPGPPSKPA